MLRKEKWRFIQDWKNLSLQYIVLQEDSNVSTKRRNVIISSLK